MKIISHGDWNIQISYSYLVHTYNAKCTMNIKDIVRSRNENHLFHPPNMNQIGGINIFKRTIFNMAKKVTTLFYLEHR